MKKLFILPILFLLFGLFKTPVLASTATIYPSQDTYVATTFADRDLSNSTIAEEFFNQDQNQGFILLKFPLDAIPQNATISNATLKMNLTASRGDQSVPLIVRTPLSNWANNVNWFTKPDLGAGYDTINVDNVAGYKTWQITQMVKDWKSGSLQNYGIYIAFTVEQRDWFGRTFSMLEAAADKRPVLTVEYSTPFRIAISPIVLHITPLAAQPANQGNNNAALTVSDVRSQTSLTGATITWTTNKNSSSYVYYGNAQDGVNRFDKQSGQNDQVTDHQVKILGLNPAIKYSFKAASVDSTAQTTYSPISFFFTLSGEAPADAYDDLIPTPTVESQNPISEIQSGVENKIAEYVIEQSTASSEIATPEAGLNTKALSSRNPLVMIAGMAGTNRMAGIVMIILGILSLGGALILFETGRRVHKHVKTRLKKKKR